MRAVLATNPDGSVAVIHPSMRCVEVLRDGGGINCAAHSPSTGVFRYGLRDWLADNASPEVAETAERTGYLPLALGRAWEMEKFLRDPNWRKDRPDREALAARWVDAMAFGGLSETEAIALIGEFSAPLHATALETVDVSDLPERTHRAAWRRSRNGGPVWIDEAAKQKLDEVNMWRAYERTAD